MKINVKHEFLIVAIVAIVGLSLLMQLTAVGFAPAETVSQQLRDDVLNKLVKVHSKVLLLKDAVMAQKQRENKEGLDDVLSDLVKIQRYLEYILPKLQNNQLGLSEVNEVKARLTAIDELK